MNHRQPPLHALRVFTAVMRHQSIKHAADELCLTPQAASHQIKQLEHALGQPLFERHARGIHATAAAHLFAGHVSKAFNAIDDGVQALAQLARPHKLYLHVSPYFASTFLIPHLSAFTARHPEIDLRISIGADLVDFSAKEIDVAIHWTYGGLADYAEIPLMVDFKVVVCRPEVLAQQPIETARDLLQHNLITPLVENTLWPDVLTLLGIEDAAPRNEIRLHTNGAMLEAALAGIGVALVSHQDAVREIRAGRLVAPLGERLLDGLPLTRMPKFFLLLPKDRPRPALVETFRVWLQTLLQDKTEFAFSLEALRETA